MKLKKISEIHATFSTSVMRNQKFKNVHALDSPSQPPPPWIKENDVFVGNLSLMTNEETLKNYFANFGEVTDVRLQIDKRTGRSRRFAFVSFEKKESVTKVLDASFHHSLDGMTIDVKKCFKTSRECPRLPVKTQDPGPIFNVPPPTSVDLKFAITPHPPPSSGFQLPSHDHLEFEGGVAVSVRN